MKKLTILVLALGFSSAQAHAGVVWGRSTENLIYCFPADAKGRAIPGSYPVDDSYCIRAYGADWGTGKDGVVRCYPRSTSDMPAPRFPIHASWCAN
jgi:hypothetical protein